MPTGEVDSCNSCLLEYNNKERTPKVPGDGWGRDIICSLPDPEVLPHLLQVLPGAVYVPGQHHHLPLLRRHHPGQEVTRLALSSDHTADFITLIWKYISIFLIDRILGKCLVLQHLLYCLGVSQLDNYHRHSTEAPEL